MSEQAKLRSAGTSSLRLFVALELPQHWLAALAGLQQAMRSKLAAGRETSGLRLRWTRPEGIHLTLKFLGQVGPERLDAIDAALRAAVTQQPGFSLRLGRTGSFGGGQARVIWVGVEAGRTDLAQLQALAEQVDAGLEGAGFARERRAFTPHLTLARLPDGLGAAERQAVVRVAAALQPPATAPFEVRQVSLIRSHLGPGGARYERLASYPVAE